MPRPQRFRYSLNLQLPNRIGHSVKVGDDPDSLQSFANILRRDYLRDGVFVTVYDSERGQNIYEYTTGE